MKVHSLAQIVSYFPHSLWPVCLVGNCNPMQRHLGNIWVLPLPPFFDRLIRFSRISEHVSRKKNFPLCSAQKPSPESSKLETEKTHFSSHLKSNIFISFKRSANKNCFFLMNHIWWHSLKSSAMKFQARSEALRLGNFRMSIAPCYELVALPLLRSPSRSRLSA